MNRYELTFGHHGVIGVGVAAWDWVRNEVGSASVGQKGEDEMFARGGLAKLSLILSKPG